MVDHLDEQEQVELVKSWLRENGPWLIAGVLIGVVGLWGWNAWQARKEAQAVQASTQYDEIVQALERKDRAQASTLATQLHATHGGSPYADQADLALARAAVEADDLPKAAQLLSAVMSGSSDDELRLLARVRLARVELAQGNADKALATLDGAQAGALGPQFDDVRGDILLQKGDKTAALREYLKAQGGAATGVVDTQALDLKIGDLRAQGIVAPQQAAAPVAAVPAAAKP